MWACITVTLFDAIIDLKTTAMVSKKSRLETSGRDRLKLSIIYNYWIRPSPNPP